MKTIEERAKELFPDAFDADEITPAREGYIVEQQRRGYRTGATEQKKIDIDKACEAFDKAVGWCATYPWYDGLKDEFRKAMEDGQ